MARHNLTFLAGMVLADPIVQIGEDGVYKYGFCTLAVVRGTRDTGDKKRFARAEDPRIMSRDPGILKIMATWKENDIVLVKGVVCATTIDKKVPCPNCGYINYYKGSLVYVNPIFVVQLSHAEGREKGIQIVNSLREISNQAYVLGTVCKDPKKVDVLAGIDICQYPIALNRKYFIRSDPPEQKTDYPWVKSYGANALEDLKRIHTGTQVYIDGCLQARHILKHAVCGNEECRANIDWKDRTLEIVPYETEYVRDFYTDADLVEQEEEETMSIRKRIFGENASADVDDDWT